MNIFILDKLPQTNAASLCDQHVPKMILETTQIFCTALHLNEVEIEGMYKPTHIHHPCVKWAAEHKNNCLYLFYYAYYLNEIFKRKSMYLNHKSYDVMYKVASCWINKMLPKFNVDFQAQIKNTTPFVLAMPEECKVSEDPIECYREYYRYKNKQWIKEDKKEMRWSYNAKPIWFDHIFDDSTR